MDNQMIKLGLNKFKWKEASVPDLSELSNNSIWLDEIKPWFSLKING
jgi:hypothetical protein